MKKRRVHEISKELKSRYAINIDNKALVAQLIEWGYEVKTHSSTLEWDQYDSVFQRFVKKARPVEPKTVVVPKAFVVRRRVDGVLQEKSASLPAALASSPQPPEPSSVKAPVLRPALEVRKSEEEVPEEEVLAGKEPAPEPSAAVAYAKPETQEKSIREQAVIVKKATGEIPSYLSIRQKQLRQSAAASNAPNEARDRKSLGKVRELKVVSNLYTAGQKELVDVFLGATTGCRKGGESFRRQPRVFPKSLLFAESTPSQKDRNWKRKEDLHYPDGR